MNWIDRYLKWRPLMSADNFWVAVLKSVPYEVVTAYGLIRGASPHEYSTFATGFLFAAVLILSVAVYFLHRASSGATAGSAFALAICFLLFALTVDAQNFTYLAEDDVHIPYTVVAVIRQIMKPFYLLSTAVIIVLITAQLRPILGGGKTG